MRLLRLLQLLWLHWIQRTGCTCCACSAALLRCCLLPAAPALLCIPAVLLPAVPAQRRLLFHQRVASLFAVHLAAILSLPPSLLRAVLQNGLSSMLLRYAAGDAWRETWRETIAFDESNAQPMVERTAHKWAKAAKVGRAGACMCCAQLYIGSLVSGQVECLVREQGRQETGASPVN